MADSLLLANFVVEGIGRLISDFVPNRLAGDYGFDPLGLGEDPESLRWYFKQSLFMLALPCLESQEFF